MIRSRQTGLLLAIAICFLAVIGAPNAAAVTHHKPITIELMQLLAENPEIKQMLEESIKKAALENPDPVTNPAQNLQGYYDYINTAVELIPQEMMANPPSIIREQILQSICYFYFLVDQPLSSLEPKGYFKNTLQFYPPFSQWLTKFANAWGAYLDTEASWTQQTYQQFYTDPSFGIQRGWYESPVNWHTFNQFFARYLNSPAERPIASPASKSIVVSPADSVPQGVWPIDQNSRIKSHDGLKVKLARFYSIEDLLGKNSKFKDAFANGVLTHTFLNVNDYHRYHFAVGGKVLDVQNISQNVALEAQWNEKQKRYEPIDSTGWQFSQTRGYVIVDTGEYGLVALMPMGMAQVSSVKFEDNVKPGTTHSKGDMLGNFLFGGSDFLMLFQKRAGFELVVNKSNDDFEHVLMGEAYGKMAGVSAK
jgi:phosphatidylserine decarboxylase